MRNTTRDLVTITVFGTLWGAVEMSLGALFHAANIPLSGAVLAAGGLAIAMLGRLFVPRRGATLTIGAIALILKLFSIGSVVIGPMIGIFAEALIAEIVLSLFGQPRRLAFVVAGSLGVLWTLGQPFITGLLFFGRDIFVIWLDLIDRGGRMLGMGSDATTWIFLFLVAVHILVGSLAGLLAWSAASPLQSRMVGSSVQPLIQKEQ